MDSAARKERIHALTEELVSRRLEIPAFVTEFRAAEKPEEKNEVLVRWDGVMKEITAIHTELETLGSEERYSTTTYGLRY